MLTFVTLPITHLLCIGHVVMVATVTPHVLFTDSPRIVVVTLLRVLTDPNLPTALVHAQSVDPCFTLQQEDTAYEPALVVVTTGSESYDRTLSICPMLSTGTKSMSKASARYGS